MEKKTTSQIIDYTDNLGRKVRGIDYEVEWVRVDDVLKGFNKIRKLNSDVGKGKYNDIITPLKKLDKILDEMYNELSQSKEESK